MPNALNTNGQIPFKVCETCGGTGRLTIASSFHEVWQKVNHPKTAYCGHCLGRGIVTAKGDLLEKFAWLGNKPHKN